MIAKILLLSLCYIKIRDKPQSESDQINFYFKHLYIYNNFLL